MCGVGNRNCLMLLFDDLLDRRNCGDPQLLVGSLDRLLFLTREKFSATLDIDIDGSQPPRQSNSCQKARIRLGDFRGGSLLFSLVNIELRK